MRLNSDEELGRLLARGSAPPARPLSRSAPIGLNFDDRYSLLGHSHDDRYLQLTGGALTGKYASEGATGRVASQRDH